MKFLFFTPFWGEYYRDLYLNVVLPTQLSPGNLPAFTHIEGTIYQIYTTSKDAEIVRQAPAYLALSELIPTEIVLIDDIDINQNKHKAWNECICRAIVTAEKNNFILLPIPCESIYPDGAFANLLKLACSGKRVVMVQDVRVARETFVPAFLQQFSIQENSAISVSARELVKLMMEHIHPSHKHEFWDSIPYTTWPAYLFWKVGSEGLIATSFHLHLFLLMLNPCKSQELPSIGIDIDYAHFVCPNLDDVYVVEDSDEIVGCQISSVNQNNLVAVTGENLPANNRATVRGLARWAILNANRHHHYCFKHKVRIHVDDLSENWNPVEERAARIVTQIDFWIKLLKYSGFRFWIVPVNFIWVRLRLIVIYLYLKRIWEIMISPQRLYETRTYQRLKQGFASKFGNK